MVSKNSDSSARTNRLFSKLNHIARSTPSTLSPEAVHQLRTTARRIETLLSAHGMDDRGATAKLGRQLARLRRRAGKLRDIDVHISALDGIRLDNSVRARALLHDHLASLRNKGEKKLVRAIEKETSNNLSKRMKRTLKKLEAHSETPQPDYTEQALSRFKVLAAASPQLTEKTLHDFRIGCKRLRYLAEITGDTPNSKRVVSLLKSIQDAIGEWHDWLTLTETAKQVLPSRNCSLMAALRAQTRSKFNEALRVAAQGKRDLLEMEASGGHRRGPRVQGASRVAETGLRLAEPARPGRTVTVIAA